jgi:hypothetical protein
VRGALDLQGVADRKQGRSKYGAKRGNKWRCKILKVLAGRSPALCAA